MNRLLLATLLLAAGAAHAQYKVVGPDGRITYTDRPPADARAVQPVELRGGTGIPTATLPTELRAPVQKFPVTLYAGPKCSPCDAGRDLLQARGVPFTEKRVESGADVQALQQLTGERNLPVLTIGSQRLRGLVAAQWQSYLDAAGYPKTAQLPANYRAPAVTPLAPPAAPKAPAVVEPEAAPALPPASASGIRF